MEVEEIPFTELVDFTPDGTLRTITRILKVGAEVWDDLTGRRAKIRRIVVNPGQTAGIWLDDPYLEGGRHPWEISLA